MKQSKTICLAGPAVRQYLFLALIWLCLPINADGQSTPTNIRLTGYDAHLELRWNTSGASFIRIYRSSDEGQTFQQIARLPATDSLYLDWVGPDNDTTYQYRIIALDIADNESEPAPVQTGSRRDLTDAEFLDMVQEYTFRYFWDFAHPNSGLTRERNTSGDLVTMGGSGFGLMAVLVGIERGYITRDEGLNRLLNTVIFLERANRYYGVFPHWMNGHTGRTIPFSQFDDGGDLVETAFLLEGLLTVRAYFDGDSPNEVVLRQVITGIWEAVNWNWYRQNDESVLTWHWSPNHGFRIDLPIRGWNESMIIYVLGASSPTNAIPARSYHDGWAGGNYKNGFSYFDYNLPLGGNRGGPLFFVHYSYLGLDPRGLTDEYANYFEQGRNQTLINRAWCISNPGNYKGYGENCWGLTASDNPFGYQAHAPTQSRDNGTITPTAALSSMPYTPDESLAALKHMYRTYGEELWGPMGFHDAFNPTQNWTADSYLAIDQGPIICMIENYRTGLLWDLFMSNEDIQNGLDRLGIERDSTTTNLPVVDAHQIDLRVSPNPLSDQSRLTFAMEKTSPVTITLLNAQGQPVQKILDGSSRPAGLQKITLNNPGTWPAGMNWLLIQTDHFQAVTPIQIFK